MKCLAEQIIRTDRHIEHNTHQRKDREHQPPEPGALLPERIPKNEQRAGYQQRTNTDRPGPGKNRINSR